MEKIEKKSKSNETNKNIEKIKIKTRKQNKN